MISSNERIKSDVKNQLQRSAKVNEESLDILVKDKGGVTLTGTVQSLLEKKAACELARKVLGVTSVENKIQVNAKDNAISKDEELNYRINRLLLWNSNLDSSDIRITVNKGIITLTGVVDAFWKKRLAEDLVVQLTGTRGVKNDLKVSPKEERPDKNIGEDIVEALKRNISVDVEPLNVKVKNGKVTVSGKVSSSIAKDAVTETIQSTSGVRSLENNLKIRY